MVGLRMAGARVRRPVMSLQSGRWILMLWTIVVILITLWLLGLVTGFTMGSFIHILFAMAIVLVLVSINQEVTIYRELRHMSRSRR
jgi:hypothetical protein